MLFSDQFVNPQDWRILRILAIYRVLLLALLLALLQFELAPFVFDQSLASRLSTIIAAYAAPTALLLLAAIWRAPSLSLQAHAAYLVDAAAIISLIHFGHGAPTGIGALLVMPTVGCSLVLRPRLSLLLAAITTFVLFGDEFLRQSEASYSAASTTNVGLLCLTLFVTTVGASFVAQRARASEAQAVRVGSDLATLERLNARIVESMDTAVVVLDEDRRLRRLNAAARLRLDCGPGVEGRKLAEVSPELDGALRAWDENPNFESEALLLGDRNSRVIEVLPRFIRLGTAAWAPVLVQLEDLEQIREHAQQIKLAALGRLSAGIAHEIRNPLSAIRHASQLLAESTQLAPEDQRLLDMIQRHTVRIDRIISDVLGLSRPRRAQPQSLLLREFLERSIVDYREAMPDANRVIDFGEMPDGMRVRFDPDHLRQVLHNLWHNSFEHGTRTGQKVRVRLEAGRLNPGPRPYLDIIDDGPGIPAAVREQLFEPFFTTANKGTGLGLYLSRELCEYNHARLSNLARDAGAQFRITFTAG